MSKTFCLLETPYVNPKGFKATSSALRAWEATLIVLCGDFQLTYQCIMNAEKN